MKQVLLALGFAVITGAIVQTATAAEQAKNLNPTEERYSIMSSGNGYVRTNLVSGQISTCLETSGQLVCRMAADDRQAYEADIADLSSNIASMEKRIGLLERQLNAMPTMDLPKANPALESESEFQTSLNRMEQFFQRFMGIVKEFKAFGADELAAPDRL